MTTYSGPTIGYVGGFTMGNNLVAFMSDDEAVRFLEEDPAVRRVWAVTLSDPIEVKVQRAPATLVAADGVVAAKHVEHYRTCGCLGDSAVCCDATCPCR